MHAARRSLDIANLQYREGMADFERVLDAQRALFSQQERVVSNRGTVVSSLIAVYKAMGGGWQAGRTRPLLDDATVRTMQARAATGTRCWRPRCRRLRHRHAETP